VSRYQIRNGDVLAVLRELPDNEFDALMCDPPYGISFMSRKWDYDVPSVDVWREALRVLKPGAPLVAFGGSRTYHRMAVGIEDAGFELRDCLMWLYSKGFPKSLNFGCRCGEPKTQHNVRSVQAADLQAPEHTSNQPGQVLQPSVPQPRAPVQGVEGSAAGVPGTGQSGLEGRGHVPQGEGELRGGEVRALPDGPDVHGTEGRLRDGASAGHGETARPAVGAHGSGAPQGPQPPEQRARESGAVPRQRHAQASGSRCEACGGVVGWSGYGTALKPAFEPIVLARKPLEGTVAANIAKWGVGGLAIDACRIGAAGEKLVRPQGQPVNAMGSRTPGSGRTEEPDGRWPANLLLDEDAAAVLDAEVGTLTSGSRAAGVRKGMGFHGASGDGGPAISSSSGGPSRFFYTSKVSTREREAGCEHLPKRSSAAMTERSEDDAPGTKHARAGAGGSTGGARNHHPTLKPLSLTQWLARLILPPTPGSQLLVPYSGAGSEMIGALLAGWPAVFGIEGEAEYVQIAEARIAHWVKDESEQEPSSDQLGLFANVGE
jgi:DNA modification methylase